MPPHLKEGEIEKELERQDAFADYFEAKDPKPVSKKAFIEAIRGGASYIIGGVVGEGNDEIVYD